MSMAHAKLPPDLGTTDLRAAGTVFRNRSFVLLWIAQVLSQLGGNMLLAALMAVVVEETGSNTLNAVLILTFLVPAVVFSAIAGVLVERSDARQIMLVSNAARAGLTLLFLVVGANVAVILVVNLLISTVTAFFAPAELTSIPRLVERRHLLGANSVFVVTINGAFAVGFGFLGPLLLTAFGVETVYVVVAVMFGLAALAILPLPAVPPEKEAPIRGVEAVGALTAVWGQLQEGIRYVRTHRRVAWSLAYLGYSASLIGILGALGPGFATDILRLRPQDFFYVMGPAGLGAVIGIVLLNSVGRGLPKRLVIDVALLGMTITLLGLAAIRPLVTLLGPAIHPIEAGVPELSIFLSVIALVSVVAAVAGIEYALIAIPAQTSLQEELPVDVRGRIFGILNTLLSVASFVPVIVAPIAADLLNIAWPGAGIPVVLVMLAGATLYAGGRSWRDNARAGLHSRMLPDEADEPDAFGE